MPDVQAGTTNGTTRITVGYAAVLAVLGASVFAVPRWSAVTWVLAGLLCAGAIGFGVRRHVPRRRSPWGLLAAAMLAMAAGDALFAADAGRDLLLATLADVCYLAMFPLIAVGLMQLTQASVVLRDRSRLLGLLMFTVAAALVAWVYLIGPSFDADRLTRVERSTLAAYILGDLLLLVTTVRLVVAARRSTAVILLAAGAAASLAADAAYALSQTGDGWHPGQPAEIGYLLLYLCWGAAALHPSMVELTAPIAPRPSGAHRGWTVLLGVSLVIPPGLLLVESLTGRPVYGLFIAVASLFMLLLVFTHLTDTIRAHRQSVTRERGLRQMCGALVAAVEAAEVECAVRAAVEQLMPAGTPHGVVVVVDDPQRIPPAPPGEEHRRTRMTHVRTLHPDLADRLRDFEDVLVCPLVPDQFGVGTHAVGSLFVAADGRVLAAARDAVEVLAAQATLALERILLTEAMNRRDSERYLRTVVQNTADVVLVVDAEERIRYASPSLVRVLGVDPPVSGALRDIVDPADHGHIRQTLEWAGAPDGTLDCWGLQRPDGSLLLVEVTSRDLRKDRMVRGFVITMRDVTGRRDHDQEGIRRSLSASPAGQNRRSATNKFR
jgi:PAS domain S-box-containing protein